MALGMARGRRRNRRVSANNEKSTWENTAKEQPYLMPGTEEYEERVRDLQSHNPEQDDEFHEKLEAHNESVPVVLKERSTVKDVEGTNRRWRERVKEGMYETVSERLQREAAMTETPDDDRMVASLKKSDFEDYTSDPTVFPDDYEAAVLKDFF